MKRDIDLARQLLLDIEARGADCSVSVLRTEANHDAEERIRYHLRLLVDGGYLKEIDRTAGGVPCLRLTDAGHEFIELARNESLWSEAKWVSQERTGGLALAVVRGILVQWALAPRPRYRRRYEPTDADSLFVNRPRRRYVPAATASIDYDADRAAFERMGYVDDWHWDFAEEAPVRYVRVRPERRNGWRRSYDRLNGDFAPHSTESTLPEHLI
jgi:hypothetical protein